ncbi:MAG: electron transfer flavoprotein subunit beta/FixA family protein [Candidatus Korarchaeota archaeon]|nr:electron transfer flavoprotein subunit beta/FixA family protein [Candidatus Korarchaeota archaeon]NIU85693.1 electron transfer flavoprotein subunit beta [Candidatus Thorarchaeota archaeon]NIW15787.1 electron transfer flavoprotein subunit beta [Candidatus Thorarchaeota archaeon]NIW53702.1 electron transfer flavoprotein subunit beta [Candidatus Korarchaeota archaeon]
MKFVTCVKQVPDVQEINVDEERGTIIREGVPSILNPFDEFALNLAVEVKDRVKADVELIALSMGPPQAEEALKKCLAIGADKAILLTDKVFAGADTWATSLTLARAIEKLNDVKMIFCGQEAIDGSTGQVGPELANILSLPQVTYVEEIEDFDLKERTLICRKEIDEGYVRVKSKIPALVTCLTPPDFEPRIPNVRDILKAKKKPLIRWGQEKIDEDPKNLGLTGSFSRVINMFSPTKKEAGEKITASPEEAVEKIVEYLKR